jgi:hypothetical protein
LLYKFKILVLFNIHFINYLKIIMMSFEKNIFLLYKNLNINIIIDQHNPFQSSILVVILMIYIHQTYIHF